MAGRVSKWTPDRLAQIEALRAEGLSRHQVAERLGVSFDSLKCQLDRMVCKPASSEEARWRTMATRGSAELARRQIKALAAMKEVG